MDSPSNGSFENQAEQYFNWSWKNGEPIVWQGVEKPALTSGIKTALESLNTDNTSEIHCLDAGIGAGKVVSLLYELGIPYSNIDGLDISPSTLDLVKEVFPDIQLFLQDISDKNLFDKIPAKQAYDIVTGSMLLNHLDDNQLRFAINNIFELLKDNGYFIGLVPFRPDPTDTFIVSDTGMIRQEDTKWGSPVTYHHLPLAALHEYFELSGFYPSLQAVGNNGKYNRILIIARKSEAFRKALEETPYSINSVSWRNYVR